MDRLWSRRKTAGPQDGTGLALSVDVCGITDVAVVSPEPTEPRPPDEELNRLYGMYLDELKIPPGHRAKMLRQPAHVKWKALSNHQHLLGVQSANAALNTALRCNELLDKGLRDPVLFPVEDAVELRVQLSSTGEWMMQFLDEGGLDKLVDLCAALSGAEGSESLHVECLACVRTTIRTHPSALEFLCVEEGTVSQLFLNFDSDDARVCLVVLEIMLLTALHSFDGHLIVLEAIDVFRSEKEEPMRFFSLVDCLRSDLEGFDTQFKANVFAFLNTLVNRCDMLEDRIALRADLVYLGIGDVMEDLANMASLLLVTSDARSPEIQSEEVQAMQNALADLTKQIDVFRKVANHDNEEVLSMLTDGYEAVCADDLAGDGGALLLSDHSSVFGAVHEHAVQCGRSRQLLEILQCLLVIPADSGVCEEVWDIVADIVRRIVTSPTKAEEEAALSFSQVAEMIAANRRTAALAKKVVAETQDAADRPGATQSVGVTPRSTRGDCGGADQSDAKQFVPGDAEAAIREAQRKAELGVEGSWDDALLTARGDCDAMRNRLQSVEAERDSAQAEIIKLRRELEASKSTAANATNNDCTNAAAPLSKNGNSGRVAMSDDPTYAKYFKMLKMKVPRGAVENKMRAAGLDPSVLDNPRTPAPGGDTAMAQVTPVTAAAKISDDPAYAKFFKMLKMKVPRGAVENKMRAAGLDPSVLDNPEAPAPSGSSSAASATPAVSQLDSGPRVADDPAYAKFFKMLKMKVPRGAVENKMRAAGLDPSMLDKPDASVPASTARDGGSGGGGGGVASLIAARSSPALAPAPPLPPAKPKKPSIKPSVPMRALFWSKLADDKIDETVWKELTDEGVDIHAAALEARFCRKITKAIDRSKGGSTGGGGKGGDVNKSVSLLDPKRQQQVGLALGRLRMAPKKIMEAVLALDESVFGAEQMVALLGLAPTAEEAEVIGSYDGPRDCLGKCEQFMATVLPIPRFAQRLKAWGIKLRLLQQASELKGDADTLGGALRAARESSALRKALSTILAIGNYLNGSTSRGGAYGFKLDTLSKVSTIKSVDNTHTLMRFLVEELALSPSSEFSVLLELPSQLDELREAIRLPLSQTALTMKSLERDFNLVKVEVDKAKERASSEEGNVDDQPVLVQKLGPFVARAEAVLSKLRAQVDHLEKAYAEIVAMFGEDPNKMKESDKFFGLLFDFAQAFERERLKVEAQRAREQKAAQTNGGFKHKTGGRGASGRGSSGSSMRQSGGAFSDIVREMMERKAPSGDVVPPLRSTKPGGHGGTSAFPGIARAQHVRGRTGSVVRSRTRSVSKQALPGKRAQGDGAGAEVRSHSILSPRSNHNLSSRTRRTSRIS